MRIAGLVLVLAALALSAYAVGKVTIDPNASGAGPQKTEDLAGADARLAQKVTISEPAKPVRVVLGDLTKATGVILRSGYNDGDWQVRDRKMCIFAKDVPLVQIMNSIAHVMKFKWSRKDADGKWQYRLYMDRHEVLEADAQIRELQRLCRVSDESAPSPGPPDLVRGMAVIWTSVYVEAIRVRFGEPELKHQPEPDLDVKIKLDPKGDKLADVQYALADVTGFAVVSDSFGKEDGNYGFVKRESKLSDLLDQLAGAAYYNWDKQASVLEFRDRDWFRKRSEQIPERMLEHWRRTLKRTGTLDLPELADIARLDARQFAANVVDDETLGKAGIAEALWESRDVLRLYAVLTYNQRSAAMSDIGLDLGMLSAEQFSLAQKMLQARDGNYPSNPDSKMALWIACRREGKVYHYTFAVSTTDNLPVIQCEFTTPRYQEPKNADKPR